MTIPLRALSLGEASSLAVLAVGGENQAASAYDLFSAAEANRSVEGLD